ncbi:hypothetical protein ACEQ8H_001074 [Pleosporales sp. CAS-2024a]
MGFASFGGTKKRKYHQTNSPNAASKEDARGANATPLGLRTNKPATGEAEMGGAVHDSTGHVAALAPPAQKPKKMSTKQPAATAGLGDFLARAQTIPEPPSKTEDAMLAPTVTAPSTAAAAAEEMVSFGGPAISTAELNALRFGIQNQHGDTAFFQPSFVEDPWAKLSIRHTEGIAESHWHKMK